MILDIVQNLKKYRTLSTGFEAAEKFLKRPDLGDLATGRYVIDGDRVYAMVAEDRGRQKDEALLEAHRKYIDIQLILSGTDEMGWKPLCACKRLADAYDPEKDIAFYKDEPDLFIPVTAGMFAVFFPEDAHMPLISQGMIRKVVVKIQTDD